MLASGQQVDRYEVLGRLGEGGMATVYQVRHLQLGKVRALKVLTLNSDSLCSRLMGEGRAQASLEHANIVAVTDVLDVAGNPRLLMEMVNGATKTRTTPAWTWA